MAGPRPAWTGAIDFGGFALQVQVYNLASAGSPSFKSLCPCHKEPIEQVKRCVTTQTVIEHDQLIKGADAGGVIVPLEDDDVTAIKELTEQRTVMADIISFPPADTIPWHLATGRFRVVPNAKVPGQDRSLSVLWNGLWANDCALIVQWIKRKGSKPTLAALRAEPDGTVNAIELPYAENVRDDDVPTHACAESAEAGEMFSMFVGQLGIDTGPFVHEAFEDTVAARRAEVIAAKLEGVEIPAPEKVTTPEPSAPDLMEAMKLALAGAKAGAKAAPAPADDAPIPSAIDAILDDAAPERPAKKPKPAGDGFTPQKAKATW